MSGMLNEIEEQVQGSGSNSSNDSSNNSSNNNQNDSSNNNQNSSSSGSSGNTEDKYLNEGINAVASKEGMGAFEGEIDKVADSEVQNL